MTSYFAWTGMAPVVKRTIVFNQIGSLHAQDPVQVCGVQVASVHAVTITDSCVYVEIASPRKLDIHSDYRIEVGVKGIMGDRFINLDPGREKMPLVDAKEMLKGTFLTGPSEALGLLNKLKETIDWLQEVILQLKQGGNGKKSLIQQFKTVMGSLDSASVSIVKIAADLDAKITLGADSLASVLEQTAELSSRLRRQVPGYIDTLDIMLSRVDELAVKLDRIVRNSGTLVDKLQDKDNILWSASIEDMRMQVIELQRIIGDIRTDGLKLPVKPR